MYIHGVIAYTFYAVVNAQKSAFDTCSHAEPCFQTFFAFAKISKGIFFFTNFHAISISQISLRSKKYLIDRCEILLVKRRNCSLIRKQGDFKYRFRRYYLVTAKTTDYVCSRQLARGSFSRIYSARRELNSPRLRLNVSVRARPRVTLRAMNRKWSVTIAG